VLLNAGNIGLSILFVWGLDWGLAGAAWATLVAETATAFAGALLLSRSLDGHWRQAIAAIPNWPAVRRMIQVNGDIVMRSLTLILVIAVFTRLGAGFGPMVLAANAILMTIFYMSGAVMDGLATASQQLSGRFYGARDRAGFLHAIRLISMFSAILVIVYVAALILGRNGFVATMAPDPAVGLLVERYYWWTVLTPLAGSLAFILDGVFIGASWSRDLRNMMMLAAALFGLAAFLLVPPLANDGLWLALMIFMAARGGLLLARLPHQLRGGNSL
jgi:MATE family multidrug resistance protein